MTVTIVQTATAAPAALATTFAATFAAPCTAGNLIVWVIGGDKNSGTITAPADCPNLPIDLRTTNGDGHVTLALAWGEADGGETLISGSVVTNTAGGQVWCAELNDDTNTGAWARFGTITHLTNFSAVDTLALGPLTPTQDGLMIAAVAADSVNTQGTVTWSNSFTARRSTASGGGQAGLWTAEKAVTVAGGAQSTTFLRSGGTTDQHSGFLVVFAKTEAAANEGVVAGAAPRPTASLTATMSTAGALAGSAPRPTGSLTATMSTAGALAGLAANPAGALTATMSTAGALAGLAASPAGALTGDVEQPVGTGQFGANAPVAVGSLLATEAIEGVLEGQLASPVADLIAPHPWTRPARAGAQGSVAAGLRGASGAVGAGLRAGTGAVQA